MRALAAVLLFGLLFGSLLAAQAPTPLKTVDLSKVKFIGSGCEGKWQDGFSQLIWLDDHHFAAFLLSAACSDAASPAKASGQVVVFDNTGSVEAAVRQDGLLSISRGPRGTIAELSWGRIELLDTSLRSMQSLNCPNVSGSCGVILAPNSAFNSEFAVCSTANAQQICDFYRGWPAEKVSSRTTAVSVAENPYTHADVGHASWQVGDGETWFFDNGLLTRARLGQASSLVSSQDFVGKNGGNCEGQLSDSEPRRFLAVCTGAHWYSDGMFDNIFGFSRVVLFDAPSGRLVMKIDGPAFTSGALSPAGKRVVTLRDSKVRIYEVN